MFFKNAGMSAWQCDAASECRSKAKSRLDALSNLCRTVVTVALLKFSI